jgi:hypothetical protein
MLILRKYEFGADLVHLIVIKLFNIAYFFYFKQAKRKIF